MKRLFFFLVLLWAAPVWGQALTQTPNLGLYLIPFGYPNYHIPINDNTAILDTKVTTLNLACNDGEVPTWAKGKFSVCGTIISGGSGAFSDLTSGSNTSAAMVVGSGASLAPTGTGLIRATLLGAATVTSLSPCSIGNASRGINSDGTPFGCFDVHASVLASAVAAASSWRTNLSLVPGVNVQGFDLQLSDIAGLTPTDNRIVGSNASNLIFYSISNCPGQAIDYTASTHTFSCLSSAGTVTGSGTTNKGAVWSSASAIAAAQWYTEDGSGALFAGQTRFGTIGTNDLTLDPSAITGHKTQTYQNATDTFVYRDTNDILTNKTLSYASNAITIPDIRWFDAAACQDTTASHVWDYLAAEVPAVICDTGSNTQKAYLAFDDSTDEAIQFKFRLGAGYQSINWVFRWKGVATTGAVGWCVQLVRVPDGSTSDPAFPAQASGNCVSDTAKGTTLQENEATITGVTCTSCAAGDLVYGRLSRDANGGAVTDSFSGDAFLLGWERTIIYTH